MGLNYVRRPPREQLDSPNDFITYALGLEEITMQNQTIELIIDKENEYIDAAEKEYQELQFY